MERQYPDANPVVIDQARLKWSQEMHETNVRLVAEDAGNYEPKRRWWQKNRDTPETSPKLKL